MRIVFMGTPEFAVPSLRQLIADGHEIVCVLTQPDKPKNRGMKLMPSPVKVVAMEHQIEVYQPVTLKSGEALERLSGGAGFDLIFLDPPYRMAAAYADALGRLRALGLLRRGALAVLERSRTSEAGVPAGFRCVDARAYGETVVEFVVEGEDG